MKNKLVKVAVIGLLTATLNVSIALACFCSIPGFHNGCPSSPLEECAKCWDAHCGTIKPEGVGCTSDCTNGQAPINCGYPDC